MVLKRSEVKMEEKKKSNVGIIITAIILILVIVCGILYYVFAVKGDKNETNNNEETNQNTVVEDTEKLSMTLEEFPKVDGATAMLPMIGEITKSVLGYSDEEAQAYLNENTPGLFLKEDYKERSKQNLPLANDYIERVQADYKEYTNEPNAERTFQFLFEQLKRHNEDFGFEESKDFFLSISKKILPIDFDPKDLKIVNLLKEDPSNCDIVSIYGYNGVNYLLRGGDESTTVRDTIGKISTGQIENLLFHGFEPRKKSDTLSLNEVLEQQLSLSMKNII